MSLTHPKNLRDLVNIVQLRKMQSIDQVTLPNKIRSQDIFEALEMIDLDCAIKIKNFASFDDLSLNQFIQSCIDYFCINEIIEKPKESLF